MKKYIFFFSGESWNNLGIIIVKLAITIIKSVSCDIDLFANILLWGSQRYWQFFLIELALRIKECHEETISISELTRRLDKIFDFFFSKKIPLQYHKKRHEKNMNVDLGGVKKTDREIGHELI